MKLHHILRTFNGSQSGNDFARFEEGTVAQLSEALAAIAVKEGWAKLAQPEAASTPAARETKVTGPDETKPLDIAALKRPELLAMAKQHGLELKANASNKDIIAAIEAANTPPASDSDAATDAA